MPVFRILSRQGAEITRFSPEEMGVKDEMTVGRSSVCTVPLKDLPSVDQSIGRVHFSLIREGPFWRIVDGSTSVGLYKDGQQISGVHLSDGDIIKFGVCFLVVGDEHDPILFDFVWETQSGETGRSPLWPGANTIGNSSKNTICIRDASCSRQHARINVLGDKADLDDAGSKNGTKINERPITAPAEIHPGDALLFGSVKGRIEARRNARAAIGAVAAPVGDPAKSGAAGVVIALICLVVFVLCLVGGFLAWRWAGQ